MTSIRQVVWKYHARGFRICNILADVGFECTRDELSKMVVMLNVTSRMNTSQKLNDTLGQ